MQAVKIAFAGSRKLRTIKSKRRVCLICNDANNTNLELFIANEYLTPPVTGFTGTVTQAQEVQSQALTGLLFIDSDVDQGQKAQSQQASGVLFVDCNVIQSQLTQGQDIVCVTDAVDPAKDIIFSGGTWYREPDKPKQIVRGRVIQRQAVQDENGLLIYAIGANGFTKQAHAVENNRGMAGVFGKAESGNHRAVVKSKGYIKTAEDEILELLQLLSA